MSHAIIIRLARSLERRRAAARTPQANHSPSLDHLRVSTRPLPSRSQGAETAWTMARYLSKGRSKDRPLKLNSSSLRRSNQKKARTGPPKTPRLSASNFVDLT